MAAHHHGFNDAMERTPLRRRWSRRMLLAEAVFLGSVEQQQQLHTRNSTNFSETSWKTVIAAVHYLFSSPPAIAAWEGLCLSSQFPIFSSFRLSCLSTGAGSAWCCGARAGSTGGGRVSRCLRTSAPAPGRRYTHPVQSAWAVPVDPKVRVEQESWLLLCPQRNPHSLPASAHPGRGGASHPSSCWTM